MNIYPFCWWRKIFKAIKIISIYQQFKESIDLHTGRVNTIRREIRQPTRVCYTLCNILEQKDVDARSKKTRGYVRASSKHVYEST